MCSIGSRACKMIAVLILSVAEISDQVEDIAEGKAVQAKDDIPVIPQRKASREDYASNNSSYSVS